MLVFIPHFENSFSLHSEVKSMTVSGGLPELFQVESRPWRHLREDLDAISVQPT
jgi:hypothetical protein